MTLREQYENTIAAVELLRSFNVGCAPDYACSFDYDSPCEIRIRAMSTLHEKAMRILLDRPGPSVR